MKLNLLGGAKQQEAFEKIKICLSSPPVLKAHSRGVPFRLYVAAEDKVIGAVLTQETEGKEYIITYLSRRLIDAETRYTLVFSNPRLLFSFVPAAFEDVLSGLPTSEQP